MVKMQLNEKDISRLIKACECYQDRTGSEYMWDEYEHLLHKLHDYQQEYDCPDCVLCTIHQ